MELEWVTGKAHSKLSFFGRVGGGGELKLYLLTLTLTLCIRMDEWMVGAWLQVVEPVSVSVSVCVSVST